LATPASYWMIIKTSKRKSKNIQQEIKIIELITN